MSSINGTSQPVSILNQGRAHHGSSLATPRRPQLQEIPQEIPMKKNNRCSARDKLNGIERIYNIYIPPCIYIYVYIILFILFLFMLIFWSTSPIHLKRKIIVQAFLEKDMLVFRVPGNHLKIFQESKVPALASNMKLFCSACHSMTSWLTQRDNKTCEGHKGEPHYLRLFLFCGESTWLPWVSVELFLTTFIF